MVAVRVGIFGCAGLLCPRSANPRTVATHSFSSEKWRLLVNDATEVPMRKIVPDPPPVLCVGPNLSHNDAIQHAEKHVERTLRLVKLLPPASAPRKPAPP